MVLGNVGLRARRRTAVSLLLIWAAAVAAMVAFSAPQAAAGPQDQPAGSFVPLPPSRILDTRVANGVPTTTPIPGQSWVDLQVTGRGGVPASGVGAVVLNLTVAGATWDGFVTAYPTGSPKPTASNVNFAAGQVIANLVTVKLGDGGQIRLFNGQFAPDKTVHIIADVAGYYTAGAATLPGTFTPLPPSRILDTRVANGVPTTTPIPGQSWVDLQVTGRGGVPASGVGAVVLNLTVAGATWDGFVTAYPTGSPKPTASNVNFAAGQVIANLVTVKLGDGGQIRLFNGQFAPDKTVHIIADVAGYYTAGAATLPGTFTPLPPSRILDTRVANGVPTTTPIPGQSWVDLQVTGRGGVPASGVGAVVLNLTVAGATWDGFVTAYPTGSPKPTASNVNFAAGQVIANLVTVKLGDGGQIRLFNGQFAPDKTVHIIADVAGYYSSSPPADTTPPPSPTGLTATPADTAIQLAWTAVTADDLAGYHVYRSTTSDGPWTKLTASPISTTSYQAQDLTNGTTYWFTVSAQDTTGNESDRSTPAPATPAAPPLPVVNHCGTVSSSQTWTAESIHRVTCDLSVPAGVSLTVAGGATVKAAANVSISVSGTIEADGTAGAPVVFTSIKDDTVAGDTNGDATATSPVAGDWRGISVGTGGVLDLAWTRVRYAGGSSFNPVRGTNAASVSISDSVVSDSLSAGIQVSGSATVVSLVRNTVTRVGGTGINASGASVVVTDNVVSDTASFGITASGDDVTFLRNTITGSDGPAASIISSHLDASKLDGNNGSDIHGGLQLRGTFTGSGVLTSGTLPVEIVGSTDTGGYTPLRIAAGTTVTIPAGQVWKSNGHLLDVLGSLVTTGTTNNPVVFTSIKDDTVAGDTNGDATATSPVAGDWRGISVGTGGVLDLAWTRVRYAGGSSFNPVRGTNAASVSISDSVVSDSLSAGIQVSGSATVVSLVRNTVTRVGGTGINASGASVVVTDNVVSDTASFGITASGDDVTFLRNTITGSDGPAASIISSHLDASKLDGNNGSDIHGGLQLRGTFTGSGVLTSGTLPVEIVGSTDTGGYTPLRIAAGTTVTIPAGQVWKSNGHLLDVLGSLVTTGTTNNPVVFTSIKDDTVAGDTNGDATATSPVAGDWRGISVGTGGVLDLAWTRVRYAGGSSFNPVRGTNAASVSISDSVVSDSLSAGIQVSGSATVVSLVRNTVTRVGGTGINASGASVVVTDNVVSDTASFGITASGDDVTFLRNTITGSDGPAASIISSHLDASKLDGNNGSDIHGGLQLRGTFTGSGVLTSGTLPVEIVGSTDTGGYTPLRIAAGTTVTIPAGQVWKSNGHLLDVLGSLVTTGTTNNPVVFTSIKDDTVAGDTNGDATATSPAAGDWRGIKISAGGLFHLVGTHIRYAETALDTTAGMGGTFHGSVATSGFGIRGGGNYVDAIGVDWGDPSGPAPIGSGVGYSGAGVYLVGWAGSTPPPPPSVPPHVSTTHDCSKDVVFIGARGSGEAPQGDPPVFDDPADGLGPKVSGIYDGLVSELTAYGYDESTDIQVLGVQYPALGVPLPAVYDYDYYSSIRHGVEETKALLRDVQFYCPGQQIVLGGYSQGALAIHVALLELALYEPDVINSPQIAAVLLLADPAKKSNGLEETWEKDPNLYADYEAGWGVAGADGTWTIAPGMPEEDKGPIPSVVVYRTLAFCHNFDIVCAPGLGASTGQHTNYTASETAAMGAWAADQILGLTYDPPGSAP